MDSHCCEMLFDYIVAVSVQSAWIALLSHLCYDVFALLVTSWVLKCPWPGGKCVDFGAGRSGVRFLTRSYQVCGRARGIQSMGVLDIPCPMKPNLEKILLQISLLTLQDCCCHKTRGIVGWERRSHTFLH